MELGVDAAEVPRSFRTEALLHFDTAHGERSTRGPHPAEAFPMRFRVAKHLEVDLHAVHLLHAADVRVSELLEGVEEGARAVDACRGIDHLVAVHLAAPALEFVLR